MNRLKKHPVSYWMFIVGNIKIFPHFSMFVWQIFIIEKNLDEENDDENDSHEEDDEEHENNDEDEDSPEKEVDDVDDENDEQDNNIVEGNVNFDSAVFMYLSNWFWYNRLIF